MFNIGFKVREGRRRGSGLVGIVIGFLFQLEIRLVYGIKDSVGKSIIVGDGKGKDERGRVIEKVMDEGFRKMVN